MLQTVVLLVLSTNVITFLIIICFNCVSLFVTDKNDEPWKIDMITMAGIY